MSERKESDRPGVKSGFWRMGVSGPGKEEILHFLHAGLKVCSVKPIRGCNLQFDGI